MALFGLKEMKVEKETYFPLFYFGKNSKERKIKEN